MHCVQILERDRYAHQRAEIDAGGKKRVDGTRGREGAGALDVRECVEDRVLAFDRVEQPLDDPFDAPRRAAKGVTVRRK